MRRTGPAACGQDHAASRRAATRTAASAPPLAAKLGGGDHAVTVAVEDRERVAAPAPLGPADDTVVVPIQAAEPLGVAPDAHAALLALIVVAVAPLLPHLVSVAAPSVSPALVLSMVRPGRRQ